MTFRKPAFYPVSCLCFSFPLISDTESVELSAMKYSSYVLEQLAGMGVQGVRKKEVPRQISNLSPIMPNNGSNT